MPSHIAADLIARHAVLVLCAMALSMLLLVTLLWKVVQAHGNTLWRGVSKIWSLFRGSAVLRRLHAIAPLRRMGTHTLTAGRYLGIHALLSFLLVPIAVGVFFEVADELGLDEELGQFDTELSAALSIHLSPTVLRGFSFITHLGDGETLVGVVVLVAAVLLWKRQSLIAAAWVGATAGGGLLNRILKEIFERTRPPHDHGFTLADGWSFPSGHAANSMLVYGLLGYLIVRHTRTAWHLPVALLSLLTIVFVGFSRVLLQVHYFTDVLAGYASAMAWGALCIAGLEAVRWRTGRLQAG